MESQLEAQTTYYNNRDELRKMSKGTLSKDELLWIKEGHISSHWKKYAVLAGAGAGFLIVIAIVALDLLNGRVRDVSDLSVMDAPVLAYIDTKKNKKGLDGWIQRWERSMMPISNDSSYIRQIMMDIGTPLVVADETECPEGLNAIKKEIFPEGVAVTNSLTKDPEALRKARICGGVVLWVRLQDSRLDRIVQVKELARTLHFSIKGFIVENNC